MRVLRLLLVGLVGVLGSLLLVVGASGPAAACSCVMSTLEQQVEGADVIVTGVLVSKQDPPQRPIMSSGDPITYTVAVESTYQGEPRDEVVFTSAMSGASCGLERMEVDRRYTFFLVEGQDGLVGGLCMGTRGARDPVDRRLVALTGDPVVASPAVARDVVVGSSAGESSDGSTWWWLPATGAGVTALVAAWAWRRRTTRP